MVAANARRSDIDTFGLANQCRKPIVTAVTGIVFTVGIEMMLAGDIVVAADNLPVLPNGGQTRDCTYRGPSRLR